MDQQRLLESYAVKIANRLNEGQNFLEFHSSIDVEYGKLELFVIVERYPSGFVSVKYEYVGCHAFEPLPKRHYASMLVSLHEQSAFRFERGVAYTSQPKMIDLLEKM